jgi:small-conductance mechanosensitive channel
MSSTGPQADHPGNRFSRGDEATEVEPAAQRFNWPLFLAMFGLVAAAAAGWVYTCERQQRRELEAANQTLSSSLTQLQLQFQLMNERLSDLSARKAEQPPPARVQPKARTRPSSDSGAVRNDSGLRQIQSQLTEQQRQIASARQDMDATKNELSQARDNLQNNLDSTKKELSGSIARTHEEVVALQKRGERNYYEFAIDKSNRYSRVGPLSVELRKADAKHKRFDINMLVNDNELQKKNVNLYENMWISVADRPQPLELVVNKISKDHVEGYLSAPKCKNSELASTTSQR